jgi:hypothetical protein
VQCIVTYATDIRSYLTSVLIYECLILVTCHPDTLYSREQGCEDLCFRSHKLSASKKLWKTLPYCFDETFLKCVLIPAVRVVQSTRPPCNMLVTVQETMCRLSGGFMSGGVNESCRHTAVLVTVE